MNIWTYIHVFAALVYGSMMVYIVMKNPKAAINWVVGLLFACFMVWSAGDALLFNFIVHYPHTAMIENITSVGWIYFVSFYLIFVLLFTEKEKLYRSPWVYLGLFGIPSVFHYGVYSGKIINCCVQVPYGVTAEWVSGPWFYLYVAYITLGFTAGIVLLFDYAKKKNSPARRNLTYLLAGCMALNYLLGMAVSVILKIYRVYWPLEANIFLLVFAFIVLYAMAKYEFLSIKPEAAAKEIVGAMMDGFLLFDAEGCLASANRSACSMLGCTDEEMKKNNLLEKIFGRELMGSIAAGENIQGKKLTVTAGNGSQVHLVISCNGVKIDNERAGTVCLMKDITEIDRARRQVVVTEERLRDIIESANDWIWEIDAAGRGIYTNAEVYNFAGYRPEDVIGKNVFEILLPVGEKVRAMGVLAAAIIKKEPLKNLVFETHNRITGKKVIFESNVVPVSKDGKVIAFRGTSRDITDRVESELALKRSMEEMEETNRELEKFAHIISHDLKEPLRMVSSYTSLLGKKYKGKLDKDADEYIGFAVEGSTRMYRLLEDIRRYSGIKLAGKDFEKVNTRKAVDWVMNVMKFAAQETGASITATGEFPVVRGDEDQLIQVFQNLVENALKFRKKSAAPEIKISAEKKGDSWQFCVADNGIGIEKRYFEKIFEIFQRLHLREEYDGTGMGLAICRRIVERHGGRMWVESDGPGKGSAFYFTIPG